MCSGIVFVRKVANSMLNQYSACHLPLFLRGFANAEGGCRQGIVNFLATNFSERDPALK